MARKKNSIFLYLYTHFLYPHWCVFLAYRYNESIFFSSLVSSGHHILFHFYYVCITLNETPFNLAHITENVTKFICRNVIGHSPQKKPTQLDRFLNLFTNKYTGVVDWQKFTIHYIAHNFFFFFFLPCWAKRKGIEERNKV